MQQLDENLETIKQAPSSAGTIELIVRRPQTGEREILEEAQLDTAEGLVGDNWKARGYKKGEANTDMQINIMNVRATAAIEKDQTRWPLAGDQFYVDFDISKHNLPPGTRIQLGEAQLEVTAEPHLGCKKFSERFGQDATLWVNSDEGKALNLRGINAKVIQNGKVCVGDKIVKM